MHRYGHQATVRSLSQAVRVLQIVDSSPGGLPLGRTALKIHNMVGLETYLATVARRRLHSGSENVLQHMRLSPSCPSLLSGIALTTANATRSSATIPQIGTKLARTPLRQRISASLHPSMRQLSDLVPSRAILNPWDRSLGATDNPSRPCSLKTTSPLLHPMIHIDSKRNLLV
jgi:hypothetical protein